MFPEAIFILSKMMAHLYIRTPSKIIKSRYTTIKRKTYIKFKIRKLQRSVYNDIVFTNKLYTHTCTHTFLIFTQKNILESCSPNNLGNRVIEIFHILLYIILLPLTLLYCYSYTCIIYNKGKFKRIMTLTNYTASFYTIFINFTEVVSQITQLRFHALEEKKKTV